MVVPPPRRRQYIEYWKRDYQTTLDCYKRVFRTKPSKRVWMSVRHEYQTVLKHELKYYDLRAYANFKLFPYVAPSLPRREAIRQRHMEDA